MVRKKDTLNEEIIRLQQRLEQANETIGRINRALEDHVKDGEEKQVSVRCPTVGWGRGWKKIVQYY